MRSSITGYALLQAGVMLIALALAASCSSGPSEVRSVSLATLVKSPEEWEGKRVQVTGELRQFADPDGGSYGVIQDADQDRIGIRALDPWRLLVGKTVVAEGTLEFIDTFGWYLDKPTLTEASP